jgi:hypothetical protein
VTFATLLLHLAIGGSLGHGAGEVPDWARAENLPGAFVNYRVGAAPEAGMPPCLADVCQPRVAVPGYEPHYDTRNRGNGLIVFASQQKQLGAVASFAGLADTMGLRAQYLTGGALGSGPGGKSMVTVGLRWRLDAWQTPTWIRTLLGAPRDPGP